MLFRGVISGGYTNVQSTGTMPGDSTNLPPGPDILVGGQDEAFVDAPDFNWTTKRRDAYKAFYDTLLETNVLKQVGGNNAYGDVFVGLTTLGDATLETGSIISSAKLAESIDSSYVTESVWDNPSKEVSLTTTDGAADYTRGYLSINDSSTFSPGVPKPFTGISVNRPMSASYPNKVIFDTQGVTIFFVALDVDGGGTLYTGPEGMQANYGQYSIRSRTSTSHPAFYYSANGFFTKGSSKVDFLQLPLNQTGPAIYAAQAIRLPNANPDTEVVRLNWYRLPFGATSADNAVVVATKDITFMGPPGPVRFDYCHLLDTQVEDTVRSILDRAVAYADASNYYRTAILDFMEANIGDIHRLTRVNQVYPYRTLTGTDALNYLKGRTKTNLSISNYDLYRKFIWRRNGPDTTKISAYAPGDPRKANAPGTAISSTFSQEQRYELANLRRGDQYLATQVFPYSPFLLQDKNRLWPASVTPGLSVGSFGGLYGNLDARVSWDELLTNSGLAPENSQRDVYVPTFFKSYNQDIFTTGKFPGYGYMSGLQDEVSTRKVLFSLLTLYREFGTNLYTLS